MSLTPEQREELAAALAAGEHMHGKRMVLATAEQAVDRAIPVIATLLAAEREAGAAEVRARVEAWAKRHPRAALTDDEVADFTAALHPTTEDPS